MNTIQAAFQTVEGLPCWNVEPGHGSFLTMEFGEPHLKIREPRAVRPGTSRRVQAMFARRLVIVRGEWHLWIYCCEWRVYTGTKLVGDSALPSSSKRRIRRAAQELDGQKLVGVSVDPGRGSSVFTFDLGSRLETMPYDEDSEQWMLFEPNGNVLTYRADGRYSHHPGKTAPSQATWKPVLTLAGGHPPAEGA